MSNLKERIKTAEALLAIGDYSAVIDELRADGVPEDAKSFELLAQTYFRRGDSRGDVYSSSYFAERALTEGSTAPLLYSIMAIGAFRKERYGEAVDAFEKYIDDCESAANRYLYALALMHSGRNRDAEAQLELCLEVELDNGLYVEALNDAKSREDGDAGVVKELHPKPSYVMGGFLETRKMAPTPYPSNAVSVQLGKGRAPKDFDWIFKNIPCQKGCPAKTDVPGYLQAIYAGEFDKAYRINLECNVFPAVLGRVCARPCEAECRHGWEGLGEPVAICFSKRSAADFKNAAPVVLDKLFADSGKKVAVVGSGVAGLTVARQLALYGHAVTVYEKYDKPGGMMNQGIPEFRLPRDQIEKEIGQIEALGVTIQCNTAIGEDLPFETLRADFDAVVMAAGTLRPNLLKLPGSELKGIQHGLEFLLDVNSGRDVELGKNVVIIGGGFTAMDCARTAKRLGITTVQLEKEDDDYKFEGDDSRVDVWYRRSTEEMLVTPGELEELEHEHIGLEIRVSPKAYIGDENGHIKAMRFIHTKLGAPDASGRRRPVDIDGSEFDVPADAVLLATGQFPDCSWIQGESRDQLVGDDGWLKSGAGNITSVSGIFAAGDFAMGANSLIAAIGHAKGTARSVDTFLMGDRRIEDFVEVIDLTETGRIREMDEVERKEMPTLPLKKRGLADEVELGYDHELSIDESQRCYGCSTKFEIDSDKCIYCDWCVKAKPRPDCIVKVKGFKFAEDGRITGWEEAGETEEVHQVWINQEDCIRCGACVDACPVDAISIQRVSLCNGPKSA